MKTADPSTSRQLSRTPSCHVGSAGPAAQAGASVIALVGAPNSGKSTLFNAITGGRRSVGNWPGTTVEVGSAGWAVGGAAVELLDLPGAYSPAGRPAGGEQPVHRVPGRGLRNVRVGRRRGSRVRRSEFVRAARSGPVLVQLTVRFAEPDSALTT